MKLTLAERILWRVRKLVLKQSAKGKRRLVKDGPIVVAGLFSTASGIGESARSTSAALKRHGLSPINIDLSPAFGQVDIKSDIPQREDLNGLSAGTLILCMNAPETPVALLRMGLRWWQGWRVIGFWAWELAVPPPEWFPSETYLSEVWAPSHFVADTFRAVLSIPVHMVPHYVPATTSPCPLPTGDTFECLAFADGKSSLDRKNLVGAIELFQEAFRNDDSARLTLKVRNLVETSALSQRVRTHVLNDKRLTLIEGSLTREEISSMMERSHVLIAPHRSEGFGLPLAEAMAMGRAVLATGWSSNVDFMTSENSGVIPYTLVPVKDAAGLYDQIEGACWAEPDIAKGAQILKNWASDRHLLAQIGIKAHQDIATRLNGELIIQQLQTQSNS